MHIKKLELDQLNLKDELDKLERDIISIEEMTVLDVILLAENLTKTKGPRGHDLSRDEKRTAEVNKRLKNNKEYQNLLELRSDVLRDYEVNRIEIEWLIREHERDIKK